jgi:hypothetical protein
MRGLTVPSAVGDVQVWRVRSVARVTSVGLVVALLTVTVVVTAGGARAGDLLVLWAIVVLLGLGVWRWSFAPYVALTATEVVVQNPFVRRSVPYAEVDDVGTGIGGLEVRRHAGKPVAVWAVQKATWARPSRRTSRADDVAEAIRGRLAQVK